MKKSVESELLRIGCFYFDVKNPFVWASGIKSPIYCDNRKINSFVSVRNLVLEEITELIRKKNILSDLEIIAGVATGGIPMGMLIADRLKKPFIYVRQSSKQHGLKKQIEGHFEKNKKVLIVEDLISTAKSSINAFDILKKESLDVVGLVSIMSYEFKKAKKDLDENKIKYFSLTNLNRLLDVAENEKKISATEKDKILSFRESPSNWQKEN